MAIPSFADVKAKVSANEIAPFEVEITQHLESTETVAYLENTAQVNKIVIRMFPGKELTAPGIAALKASITAGGWTDVVVENQFGPAAEGIGISTGPAKKVVFVSFKPAAVVPDPAP